MSNDAKQATPMEAMQAALDHAKWLLKNVSVCELSAHNEAVRNWVLEWEQRAVNAEAALAASRARCAAAELIINRGVEIMTSDQVGQWEGVRAWLEQNESAYTEAS